MHEPADAAYLGRVVRSYIYIILYASQSELSRYSLTSLVLHMSNTQSFFTAKTRLHYMYSPVLSYTIPV